MTRSTIPLETAHIIPGNPSDVRWWNSNGMSQYGDRDSSSNTIRLKVDIHQIFDRKPKFAIVPKNNHMVAHIFHATEDAVEAVHLYHNVPLQFLEGLKMEFLLARLAWTVFPHLEIFLSAGRRRKLSRVGDNGVRVEEEVHGDQCRQIYMQSRSRSLSPRKRLIMQDIQGEFGDPEARHKEAARADQEENHERRRRGRRKRRRGSYTSSGSSFGPGCGYCSDSGASNSEDAAFQESLQTSNYYLV